MVMAMAPHAAYFAQPVFPAEGISQHKRSTTYRHKARGPHILFIINRQTTEHQPKRQIAAENEPIFHNICMYTS